MTVGASLLGEDGVDPSVLLLQAGPVAQLIQAFLKLPRSRSMTRPGAACQHCTPPRCREQGDLASPESEGTRARVVDGHMPFGGGGYVMV